MGALPYIQMNIGNHILTLALIFGLSSCKDGETNKKPNGITENISTDLALDHFDIWVENPKNAKEELTNIGLVPVPDSLSQIHAGQDTEGRYFNFLNGYLELIFRL